MPGLIGLDNAALYQCLTGVEGTFTETQIADFRATIQNIGQGAATVETYDEIYKNRLVVN